MPSIDLGGEYHQRHDAPALEERWSYAILRLHDPAVQVVLVTSLEVPEVLVNHLLGLLPDPDDARRRLSLIALDDSRRIALGTKVLESEQAVAAIKAAVNSQPAKLLPFSSGINEARLCDLVGADAPGLEAGHSALGTKSGGRRLMREAGVEIAPGREGVTSAAALVDAVVDLRRAHPHLANLVVKLDEGSLGEGNALLSLADLPSPGSDTEVSSTEALVAALPNEIFRALDKGAIVEEFITGDGITSPSVQVVINTDGVPEVISTHVQMLGGPLNQTFAGCILPGPIEAAEELAEAGLLTGKALAARGVRGRFALDTVVVPGAPGSDHRVVGLEVNLREGATTAPISILESLAGGGFDSHRGVFVDAHGEARFYRASDGITGPGFEAATPEQFIAELENAGIAWDSDSRVGVVPTMLSSLGRTGTAGAVAIADSQEAAADLYASISNLLETPAMSGGS